MKNNLEILIKINWVNKLKTVLNYEKELFSFKRMNWEEGEKICYSI